MLATKRVDVIIADRHAIIRDCVRRIAANTPDILITGEARSIDEMLIALGGRSYDLLVLEISMSGAGIDAIRQAKSLRPATPILVLSSFSEEKHAIDAFRAGASGYLSKECDGDLLVFVMRKVARGGSFVSAGVADILARSPHDRVRHDRLSTREDQVFTLMNRGLCMSAIARNLGVSVKTVSTFKSRIFEKLGVDSAVELTRYAIAHRLDSTAQPAPGVRTDAGQ